MRIYLSPGEWRAFDRDIADDPERSALQRCCGNISTLRDDILAIARQGGEVSTEALSELKKHWEWCRSGHDFDDVKFPVWKILRSLIEQAGLPWERPHA